MWPGNGNGCAAGQARYSGNGNGGTAGIPVLLVVHLVLYTKGYLSLAMPGLSLSVTL